MGSLTRDPLDPPDGTAVVAVIGAGFSGTMTAVHLLRRRSLPPTRVVLIERSRRGGGVAYSTQSPSHLLNVPAGRMSAFADDPDHFLRWLREEEDPGSTGAAFVPRPLYGRYLADLLAQAEREAPAHLTLERVVGEAVDVALPEAGRAVVRLDGGEDVHADLVVLAVGNFPPADPAPVDPRLVDSPLYARDPWAPDALEAPREEPVMLLGTGLTMLDAALGLRDLGHHGTIHAVSRRGLLPQPHRRADRPPPQYDRPATMDQWPRTALGLLQGLRREVRDAARRGVDWREVVTGIRHDTPALWRSLPREERERFLRHLRPYWETHRHRSAPDVSDDVQTMIDSRWLTVTRARVLALEEANGRVRVRLRRRGQAAERVVEVAKVINCTGPDTDLNRVADPLIASLRRSGAIRPDPLGLGLDTTDDGAVIDAGGRVDGRLHLMGPLRKGLLWENTAVPELRVEAAALAGKLASLLESPERVARTSQVSPLPDRRGGEPAGRGR